MKQWAYCRGLLGFHNPVFSSVACLSGGRETLEAETGSSGHKLNFWWGEKDVLLLWYLSLYTWEVCGSVSNFFIPTCVSAPSRWCLRFWDLVKEAQFCCVFSSFEKVSSVCVFRISLWMLGRVGCYLLYFFFLAVKLWLVMLEAPALFFFFSLLLDAHSKLWPVHSWEGLQRLYFPQRRIISSVTYIRLVASVI